MPMGVCCCGIAIAVGLAPAGSPLDSRCPVDWRGSVFADAMTELAGRLQAPYILDASVDTDALSARVRLRADHLTGAEAVRWLARAGGLEAAVVDGTIFVASVERMPAQWWAVGQVGLTGTKAGEDRREFAAGRRVDIQWMDVPLSRVAADVSAGFGTDLIVHPEILGDQPLIQWSAAGADLSAVCEVLESQLDARLTFVDGALWVRPRNEDERVEAGRRWAVSSQPARLSGVVAASGRGVVDRWLNRPVQVDRSVGTWRALAGRLSARLQASPDGTGPAIEAVGSVRGILEAGRLLGRLSWRVEPTTPERGPCLSIGPPRGN